MNFLRDPVPLFDIAISKVHSKGFFSRFCCCCWYSIHINLHCEMNNRKWLEWNHEFISVWASVYEKYLGVCATTQQLIESRHKMLLSIWSNKGWQLTESIVRYKWTKQIMVSIVQPSFKVLQFSMEPKNHHLCKHFKHIYSLWLYRTKYYFVRIRKTVMLVFF